jgi:hypothetical protein
LKNNLQRLFWSLSAVLYASFSTTFTLPQVTGLFSMPKSLTYWLSIPIPKPVAEYLEALPEQHKQVVSIALGQMALDERQHIQRGIAVAGIPAESIEDVA